MTPEQRSTLYDDLAALAEQRKERYRIFAWWAECGRKACERGSHTPSNYSNRSGSPCERCGVHVPWYPDIY